MINKKIRKARKKERQIIQERQERLRKTRKTRKMKDLKRLDGSKRQNSYINRRIKRSMKQSGGTPTFYDFR